MKRQTKFFLLVYGVVFPLLFLLSVWSWAFLKVAYFTLFFCVVVFSVYEWVWGDGVGY